jgi:hypothetical protein
MTASKQKQRGKDAMIAREMIKDKRNLKKTARNDFNYKIIEISNLSVVTYILSKILLKTILKQFNFLQIFHFHSFNTSNLHFFWGEE